MICKKPQKGERQLGLLHTFQEYITKDENTNTVDASRVLSLSCFNKWLLKREQEFKDPERAFKRELVAHVTGDKNRKPFPPDEEAAVLVELRKCRIWPCFASCKDVKIGIQGFSRLGFHEQTSYDTSVLGSSSDTLQKRKRFVSDFCYLKNSWEIFTTFAKQEENGRCRVLSRECYEIWKNSRKSALKRPERSFRQALISHLCGKDGRKPFSEEVEAKVIAEVRRRERWPCFMHSSDPNIRDFGRKSFSGLAYHEKKRLNNKELVKTEPQREDLSSSQVICTSRPMKMLKLDIPDFHLDAPINFDLDFFDIFKVKQDANLCSLSSSSSVSADGSNHLSLEFDDLSFPEFEDSFTSTRSYLEMFEDVTTRELHLVSKLKEASQPLYERYFNQVRFSLKIEVTSPNDICGDLKLLRTLRACNWDISESLKLIAEFLDWRLTNRIDIIRHDLMARNESFIVLRRRLGACANGTGMPFYYQSPNGDFVDIWTASRQTKMQNSRLTDTFIYDHRMLEEFRAIVLDRMSLIKKRVVKYTLIIDCNSVKASTIHDHSVEEGVEYEGWWSTISQKARLYKEIVDMAGKWYCSQMNNLSFLGFGLIGKISLQILGKQFFESMEVVDVNMVSNKAAEEQILTSLLGSRENWPVQVGGTTMSYCTARVGDVKLSTLEKAKANSVVH